MRTAGFIAPTAICRHGADDPNCSSNKDREITYHKPAGARGAKAVKTPDAESYEVVPVARTGRNLVLKVRYPNCATCSYEGNKVLVYLDVPEEKVLMWRKIDPHFADPKLARPLKEAPSPAARFPASAEGWQDAINYASLKERTK